MTPTPQPPPRPHRTPLPPPLTPEQREAALELGNAQRRERAEMLNAIKTATDLAAFFAVLDTPAGDTGGDRTDDPCEQRTVVARTRVLAALRAVPGIGANRADRILTRLGIDPDRRLSTLGRRQRDQLVTAVADAVASWH